MAKKTLIEHSKTNWQVDGNPCPSDMDIQLGCLQRIADSLEKIEQPFATLIRERKMYEEWYRSERTKNDTLCKRIAAYQGIITKMKKKKS